MHFKIDHESVLKTREDLNESLLYKFNEMTDDKSKKICKQEKSSSGFPYSHGSLYLANQNILVIAPRRDIGRKENIKMS